MKYILIFLLISLHASGQKPKKDSIDWLNNPDSAHATWATPPPYTLKVLSRTTEGTGSWHSDTVDHVLVNIIKYYKRTGMDSVYNVSVFDSFSYYNTQFILVDKELGDYIDLYSRTGKDKYADGCRLYLDSLNYFNSRMLYLCDEQDKLLRLIDQHAKH